jgi:hypothetical protein
MLANVFLLAKNTCHYEGKPPSSRENRLCANRQKVPRPKNAQQDRRCNLDNAHYRTEITKPSHDRNDPPEKIK